MPNKIDFLFEIGTAELPPTQINTLEQALVNNLKAELAKQNLLLPETKLQSFATPRRLAVIAYDLATKQEDYSVLKKGPSLKSAYDANGLATPALQGFARSCGVAIENLEQLEENGNSFLGYRKEVAGANTEELLEKICQNVVDQFKIAKPMRWGKNDVAFIRPVQWLTILLGKQTVPIKLFGLTATNFSYGHRFHHPEKIAISEPKHYEQELLAGNVIACSNKRKQQILTELTQAAQKHKAKLVMDEALLDEVTGLVEWPVIMSVPFDPAFLQVPEEALISAMQKHQRAFALRDAAGKLIPYFITVANIASKDPEQVITGNQRVMQARLSDAAFFYHTDCKQTLASRLEALKAIVFQAKLGTLYEKSQRIAKLAAEISKDLNGSKLAERAGLLAKTDLVTDMVGEFPELQGTMGYYYAKHDGEDSEVAKAIGDQYKPAFAGDSLPATLLGDTVALADRLDTLVGIFGINQAPSGDKDPFALRRAALGVLRILIEHSYDLNLENILAIAASQYQGRLENTAVVREVHQFILERLRAWYLAKNIDSDTITAVLDNATLATTPLDLDKRIWAIHKFRQKPEAKSLATANKRAANILSKSALEQGLNQQNFNQIKPQLFESNAESTLYEAVKRLQCLHNPNQKQPYDDVLNALAELREPVDSFFDEVMVMSDDVNLKNNRIALLAALRQLFLIVADISKLQD